MRIIREPLRRRIPKTLADAKLERITRDYDLTDCLCLTVKNNRYHYQVTLNLEEIFGALQTATELRELDTANTALVNGAIAILRTILPSL